MSISVKLYWPSKPEEYNYKYFQNQLCRHLFIDKKQDKIVSMGSCCAREMKDVFLRKGYRYLEGENNKNPWINLGWGDGGRGKTDHSSVAWERVYNTFAIKQIFQYSFEGVDFDRFYRFNFGGEEYISDLLRTRIVYRDIDNAKKDLEDHIIESKRVLTQLDVFVLTLGMAEIFESKKRGIVLGFDSKNIPLENTFKFRMSEYEENLDNLIYIYNLLKKHNPCAKIIVMVSPMHILGTYRDDIDIYSASCLTKSILVACANRFVRICEDAYYFPSYEIATILMPLINKNPYVDGHHISDNVLMDIFSTFEHMYLKI